MLTRASRLVGLATRRVGAHTEHLKAKPNVTRVPAPLLQLVGRTNLHLQQVQAARCIIPSRLSPMASNMSFHSSALLASGKRKKMKLRRNRRMAGMSGAIESHLTKDAELRKSMLQQENAVMDPDENLPKILKEQIARELKNPEMQKEFQSGAEGKQRVFDHFRRMGTQIDRLAKLKGLEKQVLERERMIMRGEVTQLEQDQEMDEEDDVIQDPKSLVSHLLRERDADTLNENSLGADGIENSGMFLEKRFRTLARQVGGEVPSDEILAQFAQNTQTTTKAPSSNMPPSHTEAFRVQRPSRPATTSEHSTKFAFDPSQKEPQPIINIPQSSNFAKDSSLNLGTAEGEARFTVTEMTAEERQALCAQIEPSPEEVAEVEAALDFRGSSEPMEDENLSEFTYAMRAERLRLQQDQQTYVDELHNTGITAMPLFIREWIRVQLMLNNPIPDHIVQPYCPPGMTPKEFLSAEGLVSEESVSLPQSTSGEMVDSEQHAVAELDTEASHHVEGSDCHSIREAVEKRHLGCLTVLCDPANGLTVNGETPLHAAAILENMACAKDILDQNIVFVNATSRSRSTALHMAALRGNLEMVKFLLQRGAKVNLADDDGLTPLHLAVAGGASTSLVNFLIENKANLDLGDNQGATALHIAADSGNVPMIRLLLQRGARINDATAERETPVFLAAERGHDAALELLLASGGDPNTQNNLGLYPLHAAAKDGHLNAVKLLIKASAQSHVFDAGDNTPLHLAVLGKHYEICRHLIAASVPIAAVTTEGWTALHIAAQVGSSEIVALLIDMGAAVDVRNDEGSNALHIALSAEQYDVVPLLLDRGINVNIGDANNVTPLLLALQQGQRDLALQLLHCGARPATLTIDHVSPLHIALEEEFYDVAEILLEKGANPVQETSEGYQPIHITAAQGNLEWTEKLIQLGANPNALTQLGVTPLRLAQENGHTQLEVMLRRQGAREMDIFAWMELEALRKKQTQPSVETVSNP